MFCPVKSLRPRTTDMSRDRQHAKKREFTCMEVTREGFEGLYHVDARESSLSFKDANVKILKTAQMTLDKYQSFPEIFNFEP